LTTHRFTELLPKKKVVPNAGATRPDPCILHHMWDKTIGLGEQ